MTTDNDELLSRWSRRIARILEHAELSQGDEAETFRQRALELMAHYRISAAHIDAARQPSQRSKIVTVKVPIRRGPYQAPRQTLLTNLAELHSCRVVYRVNWDGRVCEVIGHQPDVDVVQTLWTSLLTQAVVAVALETIPGNVNTQTWKRSFFAGFIGESLRRLRSAQAAAIDHAESRRNMHKPVDDPSLQGCQPADRGQQPASAGPPSAPSTELVLLRRSSVVDDFIAAKYPRLGSTSVPTPQWKPSAFKAGRSAGTLADLGHGQLRSPSPAIAQ